MELIIEAIKILGSGVVLYVLLERRLTRLETLVELLVDGRVEKKKPVV